jgi:hypothetical protein
VFGTDSTHQPNKKQAFRTVFFLVYLEPASARDFTLHCNILRSQTLFIGNDEAVTGASQQQGMRHICLIQAARKYVFSAN